MVCVWCRDCDGEGDFVYDGWVLARRDGEFWVVFPWREGMGGQPIVLSGGDAPRAWWELPGDAVASEVLIVAEAHGDEGRLIGADVEARMSVSARPVPVRRVDKAQWLVAVDGVRHRFSHPAGVGNIDANRLQKAPMWCWQADSGEPSWQFEDAAGFLVQRESAAAIEAELAAANRWRHVRETSFAGDAWVNPYNFVALGPGVVKAEPSLHLCLGAGRLSGRLVGRFVACAPLALSGSGKGTVQDPYAPIVVDGRHVLPGSQLAGAVRSFHEALTDSCLRVIDLDYVPVHRDLAQPQAPGRWRMAVVEPGGQRVRMCESISFNGLEYSAVWVEARHLDPGLRGLVDSSHEFHFDLSAVNLAVPDKRFRLERTGGAVPVRCSAPGDECEQPHWRTIVTDALQGRKYQPVQGSHPYHLPFARVSAHDYGEVTAALPGYRRSAEDAADVVKRAAKGEPERLVAGIGQRQETTADLTPGHVMWAEIARGEVVRIIPSVLWRSPGEGELRARLRGYEPCSDPNDLCPSCRLFGMVEEREGQAAERARVSAYRGHVRFGHAVVSDVETEPTRLREMGTPRPSAGQFYLVNGKHAAQQEKKKDGRPLREWGSAADRPEPRRIRGRKFYWANTAGDRHVAGEGANDAMSSHHRLSPVGATVTFPVWFDNLTPAQLGSLLVSLDPNLLRAKRTRQSLAKAGSRALAAALDSQLALHIGKGKGLGLGTVVSQLGPLGASSSGPVGSDNEHSAEIEVWTADRYTGGSSVRAEGLDYVEAFVDESVKNAMVERWGALLAMSAVDWVPAERVAYPPDDRPGADFQFDFWRRSSGAPNTVQGYKPVLVSLPEADAADVTVERPWLEGGGQ